jgi:hypothetical protein
MQTQRKQAWILVEIIAYYDANNLSSSGVSKALHVLQLKYAISLEMLVEQFISIEWCLVQVRRK